MGSFSYNLLKRISYSSYWRRFKIIDVLKSREKGERWKMEDGKWKMGKFIRRSFCVNGWIIKSDARDWASVKWGIIMKKFIMTTEY